MLTKGINPVFGLYLMIAGTTVAAILKGLCKEEFKPSEIDRM